MRRLSQIARIFFVVGLLLVTHMISIGKVAAQGIEKSKTTISTENAVANFTVSEPIQLSPGWVLPIAAGGQPKNKIDILSQFYPLWQEELTSGKLEQIQSVVIPCGIVDVVKSVVYIENSPDDILVLDINTGKTIQSINGVCCPIAIVDNELIALAKEVNNAKFSYDLRIIDDISSGKIRGSLGPIFLPDWLELPVDGERQKFIFYAHYHDSSLSIAWQASRKMMFPNPLSLVIPAMAQPTAFQGNFSCDLENQILINDAMQESDPNFSGYLTANENLPAQIALDSNTVAFRKHNDYLFSLIKTYPPENNISRAGLVAKRELQVKDMRSGKLLWSHTLPAAFMPLGF